MEFAFTMATTGGQRERERERLLLKSSIHAHSARPFMLSVCINLIEIKEEIYLFLGFMTIQYIIN